MKNCDDTQESRTIILEKIGTPQSILLTFIVGNSGRYFDPLKSDSKSNSEIIWTRGFGDTYVDAVLEDVNYKEFTKESMKQKIDEIADKIKNVKNNYSFANIDFKADTVNIQFNELNDTKDNVKMVKEFIFKRRSSKDKQQYLISKLGAKLDVDKSFLK